MQNRIGVGTHGAELVAVEAAAFEADAPVSEDDRPADEQADRDGGEDHQRQGKDDCQRADDDVGRPLEGTSDRAMPSVAHGKGKPQYCRACTHTPCSPSILQYRDGGPVGPPIR
jgi:hypothetical protein